MARVKRDEGPNYIDAWGKWWKQPWRRLMVEVVKLSEADAEVARLVLGNAKPEEPDPTAGDPQPDADPQSPRPPFRRTFMPPPPGATDD